MRRDNPFVRISSAARLAVIFYFLFWRILPELAAALQIATHASDTAVAGLFVRVVMELLLILPFMLHRFAGTPIGWLHPLVLPTILVVAKDIVTNPLTLADAVTAWLIPPVIPDYQLLSGQPLEALLAVELKRDTLLLLAQVCYLAGFAVLMRRAQPLDAIKPVRVMPWRFLLVIGFCFGIFLLFIEMNDGLIAHFSRLAYGRFLMREQAGHFLVIIGVLPYLLALWYAARPGILKQPWFVALFVLALFAEFATTGSRSSLIAPAIMLLALWMLINRKAPTIRIIALGVLIAVFLGVLGELRASAHRNAGVGDLSILTQTDLLTGVQTTIEERVRRNEASGLIAVMHAVPESVPHLYGITYVSSIAFFVPRTIWPDKPRGPGAHVGAIIYDGKSSTQGYTGTAIPASGVGEAYWNFGVPGVMAVYLLFGLFHRFIAHYYLRRQGDPFRALALLLSMVVLVDPSSDSIVRFLQVVALLYLSWLFVRRRRHDG